MRVMVFPAILALAGAAAPAAPPPERVAASACTRQTLLADQACTIEGKTTAQPASREQAKENQRQAHVLAEELCAAVTAADLAADPSALAACRARIAAAVKPCGGDGTRRVQDDAGRFNPGFARCYASLAELVRGAEEARDLLDSCCACAQASCGVASAQCLERATKGAELGACVDGACREACAPALLVRRSAARAPATTKPSAPARNP